MLRLCRPFVPGIAATLFAAALLGRPALAADAKPPADLTQPVTTPRVGGSPADAEFRAANEKAFARYRDAKVACRSRPVVEQNACLHDARADLKTAQDVAKAEHDAAKRR
ncbi:MAG TPA: hypothetical protein VGH48_12120 [Caldimonas sp.]|jgi:hypothetical protein